MSGKLARVSALICAAALIGITTASASTSKTVVASVNSRVGKIIAAGINHHTLYAFSRDSKTKSACYGTCSKTWIPMWAKGKIEAASGSGVNGKKLGKIRRKSGSYQVTYYGQPLYTYTGDHKAKDINGHQKYQFKGSWYAILAYGGTQAPPPGY